MSLQDLYQKPGHLIRRCQQIAVAIFVDECKKFNLTPVQYALLSAMQDLEETDQITLAGIVALDRSTTGNVLNRLEERGLVQRTVNENDKRTKLITITAQGRKLLKSVHPAVNHVQDILLAPLSEKEKTAFLKALKKIANANNEMSRAPQRDG